jgi:predicted GNAT family N-acyltransferase
VYVVERRLHEYLNSDKIPLILLAIQAGELAGAVQLKFREMTIYPDREHWIGGVYVAEKFRGKKLATTLVDRAIVLAQQMGAQALYLQTKRLDGGLYRKMGLRVTETVVYRGIEVAVMVKKIGAIHD